MRAAPQERILTIESPRTGAQITAVYEHPWAIRFCHWLNSVSLLIMMASGLRIFIAFPSFGPKIGGKVFFRPPPVLTLGGWLGGALQWHFTFAWIYVGTGIFYLGYQLLTRHYSQVLFTRRDLPGVWPMVRHYFFFGHMPAATGAYNALQKLAYTSAVILGILSVLTGLVLYNPVQFSLLASLMGGFHLARVWHFAVLCALLLFLIGHLIMVIIHGWNNFVSMLSGWKKNPEYL